MKILFLCTGNSCRSQMAEGWVRCLKGDRIEPASAGVDPKGVDPLAVQAMKEVGVVHVGFEDPPKLAAEIKEGAERIGPYRRVRDQIKAFVETLPEGLVERLE